MTNSNGRTHPNWMDKHFECSENSPYNVITLCAFTFGLTLDDSLIMRSHLKGVIFSSESFSVK